MRVHHDLAILLRADRDLIQRYFDRKDIEEQLNDSVRRRKQLASEM